MAFLPITSSSLPAGRQALHLAEAVRPLNVQFFDVLLVRVLGHLGGKRGVAEGVQDPRRVAQTDDLHTRIEHLFQHIVDRNVRRSARQDPGPLGHRLAYDLDQDRGFAGPRGTMD